MYTYINNIQLFCESLIKGCLRPRLQALKRKRVFAEKSSPEGRIMKLVQSLIVAAALAIPAVSSFAQSSQATTPINAQVTHMDMAAADSGGVTDGTSASGTHQGLHSFRSAVSRVGHKIQGSIRTDANDGMKPVYFGS